MAITIQGDNRGIAVDGNLKIEKLNFVFGQGVRSAMGVGSEIIEAEVVEENIIPVVDDHQELYPVVSETNTMFFEDVFVVPSEVRGAPKRVLDLPKVEVLHIIYDITRNWNPAERTSVHKWRVLYEVLLRLKYFSIVEKHRFLDFVEAVVRYCFQNVQKTYANNISKSRLGEHFEEWSNDDKKLYKDLKAALSAVNKLP